MCTVSGDTFTIQKEHDALKGCLCGEGRCLHLSSVFLWPELGAFCARALFPEEAGFACGLPWKAAQPASHQLHTKDSRCAEPSAICEAPMLCFLQEKRRREMALQNLQMAVTAGLSPLGVPQLGLPAPAPGAVRPPLQASSNMLMEGFPQNLLQSGAHMGLSLYEYVSIAPQSRHGTFCMHIHH